MLRCPGLSANHLSRKPHLTITRVRTDDSTSNLGRHIDQHCPETKHQQALITDFAKGGMVNKGRMRYLQAIWIAVSIRPFVIVEDPYLRLQFEELNPNAQECFVSAVTVSRDVVEIAHVSESSIIEFCKNLPGRVHASTDA